MSANDDTPKIPPGTLGELLQHVNRHDAIEQTWIKFLMGLGGAIVASLWSVISLVEDSQGTWWLARIIAGFGVVSVACLIGIIYRTRQWKHWFVSRIRHYQDGDNLVIPAGEAKVRHYWLRVPEILLDKFLMARPRNKVKTVEGVEAHFDPLPSGGGYVFNFVAWMGVAFAAVLIATPLLLPRKPANLQKQADVSGIPIFLTNRVHVVTNTIAGMTNVIRVTDVTILSVSGN